MESKCPLRFFMEPTCSLPIRNGTQMPITLRHGTWLPIIHTVWNPNAHNLQIMDPKCPLPFIIAPRCLLPVRYGTQMSITCTQWTPNAQYPYVTEPKCPLPLRTGTLIPITMLTRPVTGFCPEPGASRLMSLSF